VVANDLPESAAPGANVTVSLFWIAEPGVEIVRYSVIGPAGAALAEDSFEPGLWPPGAIIQTKLTIQAPSDAGALPLALAVAGRDARCGWMQAVTAACPLRTVRVEGEAIAPGAVNFADRILLRAVSIETPLAAPGGVVRVSLDWQALASMSEDYTVFVHLIGPDGLLHGQNDAWPVQGTRRTSGWRPGERLTDVHEIRVPADAPPGEYEVEIGWYLLATLERLPVLAEGSGAVVDDRVLAEGLEIR
jgi:hypothetical protein